MKDNEKENKTESQSSADQKENDPKVKNLLNHEKYTQMEKFLKYFEFFQKIQKETQQASRQKTFSTNEESVFYQFFDCFFNLACQKSNKNQEIKDNSPLNAKIATKFAELQSKFQSQVGKLILRGQRFKKANFFTKHLKIQQIQSSKSSQVIKIQLHLHWYKIEITILNQMQKILPFKSNQIFGSGSFGSIYLTKVFEEFIAMKCISIEKLQHFSQNEVENYQKFEKNTKILNSALKEFFFILLFSELQIGPQSKTIGGFDIIIYQDSIAFATEICLKSNTISDLKSNLFRMHMLQIVHRDIKPVNIMYSERYKKNVFIDFGCAQVLDAKIGEKSVAHFAGTTTFCSQEVLLLLNDKERLVDLYFNDVFGLRKCEKQYSYRILEIEDSNILFIKNYEIEILSLRFELYSANDESFLQQWKLIIRQYPQSYEQIQKQVLLYLRNTKPRYLLRYFYQQQISENIKELLQFQDMQLYMKDQNSLMLYYLRPKERKPEKIPIFELLLKKIAIEVSCFTGEQKQISLKLLDKKTAQKFIFQLIAKIESEEQLQKTSSENKDFITLCLVAAHYCSLFDNFFEVPIDKKVKICEKILEFIKKFHPKSIQLIQAAFQCPLHFLKPICTFSQFFLFKVFKHIPFKDKSSLMIKAVGNLCLLGVPFHRSQKILDYFINKLIISDYFSEEEKIDFDSQKEQIDNIQRMILFWELQNCFMMINKVFYDEKKTIFKINEENEKLEKMIGQNKEFMTLKRTKNNLFFEINCKLYNIISSKNKEELDEKELEKLLQLIRSIEIQESQQYDKLLMRWKKTLCISVCSFVVDRRIKKVSSIEKIFEEERILDYFFERGHLRSQLVLFYWNKIYNSHVNILLILKEIDKIIGCQRISFRIEIELRYEVALNTRDFNTLDILSLHLIYLSIDTEQFSYSNVKILKSLITQAFQSISLLIKEIPIPNQQFHHLLYSCFPLLAAALKLGASCIQHYALQKQVHEDNFKKSTVYELTTNYIEQQIDLAEFLKSFFEILLNIGFLYQEFGADYKYHKNLNLSDLKPLKYGHQADSKRFDLGKESLMFYSSKLDQQEEEFIRLLHQNKIVANFNSHIISTVYSQEDHKSLIKANKNLFISMAYALTSYRKNRQQILTCHQIINQIIGQLSQSRLTEFTARLNSKTFFIAYEYLKLEIIRTKYNPFWCEQFITFYHICKNNDFMNQFLSKQCSIHYLFICFVSTKKSFQEIKEFFVYLMLVVKRSPKKGLIEQLKESLETMLWCQCQGCLPRRYGVQDHYQFTQYLYERIKDEQVQDNPYLALLYFSCMGNGCLPNKINRAFVMYILRSMSYLVLPAKQLILKALHFHIYSSIYRETLNDKKDSQDFIIKKKEMKQMIQIESKKDVRIKYLDGGMQSLYYGQDQTFRKKVKIKKIKKSQMNSKLNRKFIYCMTQTLKNNKFNSNSLEEMVQNRFFREIEIQNYYYPPLIKKMYEKKLYQYHFVKENYPQNQNFKEFQESSRTINVKI